jgi:integrase
MAVITFNTSLSLEQQLVCPEGKTKTQLYDADFPGLYAEVRAKSQGQCTWYLQYRNQEGRTKHYKLGRSISVDLLEARQKAKQYKAKVTLGEDPSADLQSKRSTMTLTEYMEDVYTPYDKQMKKTWWKDHAIWRNRLKAEFGHLKLNQITRSHVQSFHTSLKELGLAAATCNHHVKVLRHALNVAVEQELLDKNPIAKIKLFRENNQIEHYLNEEELARLLSVLRTYPNRTVSYICLFLLSTGCRVSEALKAEHRHINRQERLWTIPTENSKGERRAVPLNDSSLAVLDQLKTEGRYKYLFVTPSGQPYTTISKTWERIREKAELPHLRLHDLRHMYASFLVNSGRTLYEVQHILGHKDPVVTMRYSHLSTRTLQQAADSASDIIQTAMQDTS